MRIDAHQHYWQLSRGDYEWLKPEVEQMYKDYLTNQLVPVLRQNDIDKTIVVQAAGTVKETEFLLELCSNEPTLAGVVGWMDLENNDFEEQLNLFLENPYFLGLRPSLPFTKVGNLNISTQMLKSLELLAKLDVPLDLLVFPAHFAGVADMLERIPELRTVIDHLGNPDYHEAKYEAWSKDLERIALHEKTYCKLSGMVTRVSMEQDSVSN